MTEIPHTPGDQPRTIGEARLDLDYAIVFEVLNQRFYGRIHKGIALVSLLCGSAAFVTVFQPNSVVVTIAGLAVGILALLEQVYDFRGRETMHASLLTKLQRFKARSGEMDLLAFDKAMEKVCIDSIPGIQGLRWVANNENMRRNGFPERVRELSPWEKVLEAIV